MLICPNCGREYPKASHAHFCDICGVPLQKKCPSCGNPCPLTDNFCTHCGHNFVSQSSSAQSLRARQSLSASYSLSAEASLSASLSVSVSNSVAEVASASFESSLSNLALAKAKSLSLERTSLNSSSSASGLVKSRAANLEDAQASDDNQHYEMSRMLKHRIRHNIFRSLYKLQNDYQNYQMPPFNQESMGGSTALKDDNHLLKQAYSTYYPYRDNLPKMYKIVNQYSLPVWDLKNRLDHINEMMSALHLSDRQLTIPSWVTTYNSSYSSYRNQFKGDQGESWACHNLIKHGYDDISHNVNIPFNYRSYFAHQRNRYYQLAEYCYNQRQDDIKGKKYYHKYLIDKEAYQWTKGSTFLRNKNRDSNQIDILEVNKYGIFIFEVKNYNHNSLWINKAGQIAWENPKRSTQRFGAQDNFLPLNRQMNLHKAAILSVLGQHRNEFSPDQWKKIRHNIFKIFVYVKSPKSSHGEIGVYKYDHSLRDFSSKFNITPVDQNHCDQAIKSLSKQTTFEPDVVSKIQNIMHPLTEKPFYLPVFTRSNVNAFNTVLGYKKELDYLYKLLCHVCNLKGILKDVFNNDVNYHNFLYKRDKEIRKLRDLWKNANFQYYNKKIGKWCRADKQRESSKYYHRKYTRLYKNEVKRYEEFYKS